MNMEETLRQEKAQFRTHTVDKEKFKERLFSNLSSRKRKGKSSKFASAIAVLSGVAVAAVVLMNMSLHYSSLNARSTTGGNTSTPSNTTHPNKETKSAPYDFSKFLPFTPLLPSNTSGLAISQNVILLTPAQKSFFLEYGEQSSKWFSVDEVPTSKPQPYIMQPNAQSTKVYKNEMELLVSQPTSKQHSNQSSYSSFYIAFLKNHVNYSLEFSSKFSVGEAEDIATHINVVPTQKPSINISTSNLSEAMKAISLKSVLPATLNIQGEKIKPFIIQAGSNVQQHWKLISVLYSGLASLDIYERTGSIKWAKQIIAKSAKITIGGQDAYLANAKSIGPCLMWIDPHSSNVFWIKTQKNNLTIEKQAAAIVMKTVNS